MAVYNTEWQNSLETAYTILVKYPKDIKKNTTNKQKIRYQENKTKQKKKRKKNDTPILIENSQKRKFKWLRNS